MLQFTQPGKRRGLFGSAKGIMPGDQPDYGMGDFPGRPSSLPGGNPGATAPPKRGGMFGEGGIGRGIAGTIGDFLLQQSGMDPVYAPTMQLRQRGEQEEAQYQRRQQDDQAQWMQREQWKMANEPPPRNDTIEDFNWYKNLGPEDRAVYDQMKPVYKIGPDGLPYPMARGQTPTAIPQAPVGKLTPIGGAAPAGAPPFVEAPRGFVPPMRLGGGAMTSGRRTPEGNALVGGVPNSAHLRGEAVDYDGPDLNALLAQARKLPGVRKAFIHDGHVHTEGKGWSAPYYGKNGTKGLKR